MAQKLSIDPAIDKMTAVFNQLEENLREQRRLTVEIKTMKDQIRAKRERIEELEAAASLLRELFKKGLGTVINS